MGVAAVEEDDVTGDRGVGDAFGAGDVAVVEAVAHGRVFAFFGGDVPRAIVNGGDPALAR